MAAALGVPGFVQEPELWPAIFPLLQALEPAIHSMQQRLLRRVTVLYTVRVAHADHFEDHSEVLGGENVPRDTTRDIAERGNFDLTHIEPRIWSTISQSFLLLTCTRMSALVLVVEKSVLVGSFSAIRLARPFKVVSSPGRSGRDENSEAAERISSRARRLEVGVRERLKSSAI